MLWSVLKGFLIGFFLTWLVWAVVSFLMVYQFNYNGPTNGATFWCILFGIFGAWRGRVNYNQKTVRQTGLDER